MHTKVTTQTLQLCHKTLERISTAKYQSDNTNKIIVSQAFEGISTAKIA